MGWVWCCVLGVVGLGLFVDGLFTGLVGVGLVYFVVIFNWLV